MSEADSGATAEELPKRAALFAIQWGASGTHGTMIAEFAIRELASSQARIAELEKALEKIKKLSVDPTAIHLARAALRKDQSNG